MPFVVDFIMEKSRNSDAAEGEKENLILKVGPGSDSVDMTELMHHYDLTPDHAHISFLLFSGA